MRTNYEIRYAAHPEDAKSYDTKRIRRDFLIEKVFSPNEVNMVYSMYDRMVVGGAMPVGEVLQLEAIDPLKAPYFLTRREMGIFNVGGPGVVRAGDAVFEMDYKEALYLGSGDREVTFESKDEAHPAKFYFNSVTAHRNYPDKKVTKRDAVVAEMGSLEGSNHRNINKMLVNQVLPTCQLQMGMTELAPGSVWNTMPAHVHSRRMEIGDWMQVNSEGIHGTKAIAPYKEDRIAFTSKDNNVYAFYLNAKDEYMPSVVKIRSFVPVSAKSVFLMGHNRPLKWKKTGDGIEIIIPESVRKNPPCDLVWGFKLKIK